MENSKPPGPKGVFLLGNIRQFQGTDRLEFLQSCQRQYGDVVHFRLLNRDVYQFNHPDHIHQILVKDAALFHKSPMFKRVTQDIIGNGLLTSDGDFHRRQRRLMQPAFHPRRIATYADVMVDYTGRMLDDWQNGAVYDLHEAMMKLTMQIVAKTLFDADVSKEADAIGQAITIGVETAGERITRAFQLPDWLPTAGNRQRRRSAQLLEETIMGMIDERRASGEDKGDLLSMLLLAQDEDDGRMMTDQQVRDEATTLFIAGHETTANALSWILYLLAQHPEVEAKLLDELETLLAGRPPTVDDLHRLRYTEMIVKESMRLYPPAWIISRFATEDVEVGDYTLKAGSIVLISQYVMHRHPDHWAEPECFIPERFEDESRIHKYVYFPFGGGPRICIGNHFALMEATLVLATLMQRIQFALEPGQQIKPLPLITLRPSPAILMRVAAREPAMVAL